MKKNPKVSIIIPVYNGSKYLSEAIDSALEQTYKNIEIIVINDGSDDGGKTRNIALSYEDKITYIEKENGGVSTALNLGIKNMTGDYFSWLSHDDLYEPNKLLMQVEEIKKHEENTILYSNYSLVDEKTNFIRDVILNHDEYNKKPLDSIINMDINGITLLIPRKAFDDCGLFDENLRCVQDYDLWLKMMKKYIFIHQKNILAKSRVHSKQVSNVNPRVISEGNQFYKGIINKIDKKTMIKYEGSEYLFLDNLEHKLRYNSNYNEAAEYILNEKRDLLFNYKINDKIKLLWLIDSTNKTEEELKKMLVNLSSKVEVGIYGKRVKGFKYFSNKETIDGRTYKYIYLGSNVLAFEDMLKILEVSRASIIGNYILAPSNISLLDKYAKFLHLDMDSIIIKNKNFNLMDLKKRIMLYIDLLKKENLVLYQKVDKTYSLCEDDIRNYLNFVNQNVFSMDSLACVCYQIAVIHSKTNQGNIKFYEECEKYKSLKYSRAWKLYNKIIRFIKKEK